MPETGWFAPSLLVLGLQALAAAASVRAFALRVAPNITRLEAPAGAIDSLGPFALALPLIAAGWRTGWDAAGPAWITIGGPVVVALLAMGAALCIAGARSTRAIADGNHVIDHLRVPPWHAAAWSAVGGVLLMLGAAHDLTVWIGQCTFAAGAVLLWMNTPELSRQEPDEVESRVGGGLTLVLLCAIVQAAAIGFVQVEYLPLAAAVSIAHAAMIVALVAGLASPLAALRMGGWTAVYGIMLGLGAISLRHLLPQALAMVNGVREPPPLRVAYGFGAFALEAVILLLLGAAALAIDRLPASRWRGLAGVILIVAAALLAGWRLGSLW